MTLRACKECCLGSTLWTDRVFPSLHPFTVQGDCKLWMKVAVHRYKVSWKERHVRYGHVVLLVVCGIRSLFKVAGLRLWPIAWWLFQCECCFCRWVHIFYSRTIELCTKVEGGMVWPFNGRSVIETPRECCLSLFLCRWGSHVTAYSIFYWKVKYLTPCTVIQTADRKCGWGVCYLAQGDTCRAVAPP